MLILAFFIGFVDKKENTEYHETYPLLRLVNVNPSPASIDLENMLTLAKKFIHLVLKGLQVLFRGQLANFLRLGGAS